MSKVPKIKLPRATVRACERRSRRSESFSLPEDIEGRTAVIYCTDEQKTVTDVFKGIIDRVSHKGSRQFALRNAERLPSLT